MKTNGTTFRRVNVHLPVSDSLGARSVLIHPHFFVAHVTHVSYHRGAKNSPEHDPNPGGRWQVCPVDDQRRTSRRQKEAKCTSKRRIEAGIKPAERNNCKSGEPLRQLPKKQNVILAGLEPYQLFISFWRWLPWRCKMVQTIRKLRF